MECVIHSYMIYRMLDFVFDISAVRNLGVCLEELLKIKQN